MMIAENQRKNSIFANLIFTMPYEKNKPRQLSNPHTISLYCNPFKHNRKQHISQSYWWLVTCWKFLLCRAEGREGSLSYGEESCDLVIIPWGGARHASPFWMITLHIYIFIANICIVYCFELFHIEVIWSNCYWNNCLK